MDEDNLIPGDPATAPDGVRRVCQMLYPWAQRHGADVRTSRLRSDPSVWIVGVFRHLQCAIHSDGHLELLCPFCGSELTGEPCGTTHIGAIPESHESTVMPMVCMGCVDHLNAHGANVRPTASA